jgi:hypothetical protein
LLDKSEYILPVRFDDTEIPGLPPTVGYLAFADHGVRGICEALLEKLQISPCGATTQTATSQATTTRTVTPEPSEYLEQRRRLPDTEILPKIYAKLRWRIGIYSTEFRKARFRDLDHCLQFMRSASVRVEGFRGSLRTTVRSTKSLSLAEEFTSWKSSIRRPQPLSSPRV